MRRLCVSLCIVGLVACSGGEGPAQSLDGGADAGRDAGVNPMDAGADAGTDAGTDGGVEVVTCDRNATDSTSLASAWEAASAGETICLATGDYGTFHAGDKPGVVTVRSAEGAMASMELSLNGAHNVRVDHVTVVGGDISGTSTNITVSRSTFTGLFVINADQMANANILLDGNTHADIDTCEVCFAGRVHVTGDSGQPSGVVIQNSVFSGGNADGVRADANGVQILGNEFFGLQDEEPFHTDPIQIYGGTHITIRGNYFHDNHVSAGIMMADGGDHNVVEDNVFAPGGYTWGITWASDDSSVIRHNTFVYGDCEFDQHCGILNITAKAEDDEGFGTVVQDNILTDLGLDRATLGQRDHNLMPTTPPTGDLQGVPVFVGGDHPTTYAGYRLAAGSPGKGAASDGADVGIK